MKIDHKLDRVILMPDEVNRALKEFIERKTRRKTTGDFHYNVSNSNNKTCQASVDLEDLPIILEHRAELCDTPPYVHLGHGA